MMSPCSTFDAAAFVVRRLRAWAERKSADQKNSSGMKIKMSELRYVSMFLRVTNFNQKKYDNEAQKAFRMEERNRSN